MAVRRERIALHVDEKDLTLAFARAKANAHELTCRFARLDATWEPIDWAEFD